MTTITLLDGDGGGGAYGLVVLLHCKVNGMTIGSKIE
jgi:hypothetical protein